MKKKKLGSVASTSCTSMVLLGVQESVFRSSVINYVKSVNKPDVFSLFEENVYTLNVGKNSIHFITYRYKQKRYVIYLNSVCAINIADIGYYIREFLRRSKVCYHCCFNSTNYHLNGVSVMHPSKIDNGLTLWQYIGAPL